MDYQCKDCRFFDKRSLRLYTEEDGQCVRLYPDIKEAAHSTWCCCDNFEEIVYD
jgi:hypothetical protein